MVQNSESPPGIWDGAKTRRKQWGKLPTPHLVNAGFLNHQQYLLVFHVPKCFDFEKSEFSFLDPKTTSHPAIPRGVAQNGSRAWFGFLKTCHVYTKTQGAAQDASQECRCHSNWLPGVRSKYKFQVKSLFSPMENPFIRPSLGVP